MFYIFRLAQYTTYSADIVVEGPDVDIESMHRLFKANLDKQIGDEPNILCYGAHKEWLLKRLEVISREGDFVGHLIKYHGFKLVLARTVILR